MPLTTAPSSRDKYYGRRDISLHCERTVKRLFPQPRDARSHTALGYIPTVGEFVAYVLYRTALPDLTVFHALHLLERLSDDFDPDPASASSPLFLHRLMMAATILACKYHMDDAFSNASWAVASKGLFKLAEVNEMEWSLFTALSFVLEQKCEDLHSILYNAEADLIRYAENERERKRLEKERQLAEAAQPSTPSPRHRPTSLIRNKTWSLSALASGLTSPALASPDRKAAPSLAEVARLDQRDGSWLRVT